MYYNIKFKLVRVTIFAHGKSISITHAGGVSVAIVIQHQKRMCRIVLSIVACLFLPHFFHVFSYKVRFLENELIEHKVCSFFSTTFV